MILEVVFTWTQHWFIVMLFLTFYVANLTRFYHECVQIHH